MEATLKLKAVPLTAMEWLICATAGIGFAFDMYEIVVQAIVLRPLLMDLGPFEPGTPQFNHWAGLMLFLPAMLGGCGGMVGGYLTDRLGRQRVLVWSIVLYGIAATCSAFATSLGELIFWRCITVAGACVEFVAAIAWLTELFPDARRREAVIGFSQVCATAGNFMIAGVYYAAVTWGDQLPGIMGGHTPWRYALLFGAMPAIPLIILRPFLPESPEWRAKKDAGTLRRPSFAALFSPRLRRVSVITAILVSCCYALGYGMLQHIPRLVPGLPQVAQLSRQGQEQWVSWVHLHVDVGALVGRLLLAALVVWLIGRRALLRWVLVLGLVWFPFVFLGPPLHDAAAFKYAVLLVTLIAAVQQSFWGNYLPRVFPLHLRGTGESFAMGFGGRVVAPLAALATTQLSNVMPGETPTAKLAVSMSVVAVVASVCALVASRWLPEPGATLPED